MFDIETFNFSCIMTLCFTRKNYFFSAECSN